MPEEILYDNQKLVVLSRAGGQVHFHPEFLQFAGHFSFKPRLCRPYRARTKGKVERSIGYVRDRFFCGRTFTDVADANQQLLVWLRTVANERTRPMGKDRPVDQA
jgi:transposase